MLQVVNQTPFAASLSVFPDVDGVESAFLVVKATFDFASPAPQLSARQAPLLATDVYWGDPVQTSLRAAGDFALPKPATDILLIGRAIAPAPGTRVTDVSLQVGPVAKTVRVFGDRQWQRRQDRWEPGDPAEWERMPLRWERAFGGVASLQAGTGPQDKEVEPRNPVGQGLIPADSGPGSGRSFPLPNLEDPSHLIATDADRPPPACFAPLSPTWMPRRSHAGTYDEKWSRTQAPYLPVDFDPKYFQVAPPDLIAPGYLQGGEPVQLSGFTQGEPLRFELPRLQLEAGFDFAGSLQPRPLNLETVLFEPDVGRFQMMWRAGLAVDKKLLRLRAIELRCTQYDKDGRTPNPMSTNGVMPAQNRAEQVNS